MLRKVTSHPVFRKILKKRKVLRKSEKLGKGTQQVKGDREGSLMTVHLSGNSYLKRLEEKERME